MPANSSRIQAAPDASSADFVLEQGKSLYDSGQYLQALDRFMQVLRRNPGQPEAREYLRLVVDQMKAKKVTAGKPSTPASRPGGPLIAPGPLQATPQAVPAPVLEHEVRQRVEKRQLLTLDLAAIPEIHIHVNNREAQVEIPSSLLFADNTGGLKEEGIPILDRVAAWLKTFGSQPVVIHCYPEETQEASANGSLFLHRYAQLYGFFVDERKLSAARFVNAEMVKPRSEKSESNEAAVNASTVPYVVISSLGGGSASTDTAAPQAHWLEFSVVASRTAFDPKEGDWTSLDIAALARKGLRSWYLRIFPEGSPNASLFSLEGKGNVLKRISWDGHDQKTGSFVKPGSYRCRLTAVDNSGGSKTQEIAIAIQRPGASAPVVSQHPQPTAPLAPKVVRKPKAAGKSVSVPAVVAALPSIPAPAVSPGAAAYPSEDTELPEASKSPAPRRSHAAAPVQAAKPVTPVPPLAAPIPKPPLVASIPRPPEPKPPAEPAEPEEDTSNAIWKQVIQFDTNEADLKPTLKASLERIGKTLEVYPLQKVRIVGFAEPGENNPAGLARQRAQMVRDTLVNEYQVTARRVIIGGGRVGSSSKVEISITN